MRARYCHCNSFEPNAISVCHTHTHMLLLCNTMYKHCRASICSLSGQMHWMLWPLCSTEKRWPTQCSTEMQISIPYFPGRSAQLSICSKSNIMPMILYLLCITAANHNAWWPNADRWCRGPLTYCHTWTLEPEKLNYGSCPSHPLQENNTIKAGGSTARAQNVWVGEWSGVDGYALDCYDY